MSAWLPAQEITETYRVTEATLAHFSERGNLPARGLTSSSPRYSLAHVERLFPKRAAEPTLPDGSSKARYEPTRRHSLSNEQTHETRDPAAYYLAAS